MQIETKNGSFPEIAGNSRRCQRSLYVNMTGLPFQQDQWLDVSLADRVGLRSAAGNSCGRLPLGTGLRKLWSWDRGHAFAADLSSPDT